MEQPTKPIQWVPNRPETWPWRFARLKQDTTLLVFAGRFDGLGQPVMTEHLAVAGTLVKIVLVSRYGDVGVTDDLAEETSFGARLNLEDLEPVVDQRAGSQTGEQAMQR